MSAELCPVCACSVSWTAHGYRFWECGESDKGHNTGRCYKERDLAIERGAEIEKLKAELREAEATEFALRESCEVAYNMGKQHPLEELEAIKTALGCQGMILADTLKVIDSMQTAAIQETLKGEKS